MQYDKHVSFSRVWLGCKDVFSPRPERRHLMRRRFPCALHVCVLGLREFCEISSLIKVWIWRHIPIVADVCSNYMQTYILSMNESPSAPDICYISLFYSTFSVHLWCNGIVLGRCCFMATTSMPTMMMMTTTLLLKMRGKSSARYLTNMRGKSQARFGPKAAASLRANLRK